MWTVDEDDPEILKADERSEIFCRLLDRIEDREDVEIVFARAVATLEAMVDAPVEESDSWPEELAC